MGMKEGMRGEFGESKGGKGEGLGVSRCGRRRVYGHGDNERLNHCRALDEAFLSPLEGMEEGQLFNWVLMRAYR